MARPKNLETLARHMFANTPWKTAEISRVNGSVFEVITLERRGTTQCIVKSHTRKELKAETISAKEDTSNTRNGMPYQGKYSVGAGNDVEFYGSIEAYRKLIAQ